MGKELMRNLALFSPLWLTVSVASLYLPDVTVYSAHQELNLNSFQFPGKVTWVTYIKTVVVICIHC